MITIPDEVQSLIDQEKVIVVGSTNKNGVANVSPRSSVWCDNNNIYWLEYFDHKSRKNFKSNPWVSIAVFDTSKQHGFQLKGKVSFTVDNIKRKIVYKITQSIPGTIKKMYDEKIKDADLEAVQFETKAIYTLDPRQESGRLLYLEKDDETQSMLEE